MTKLCFDPKGPIIVEGEVDIVDKYGRRIVKEFAIFQMVKLEASKIHD